MRAAIAVALMAALVACGVPRDPNGTLDRLRGGVVRAGYTQAPPWASGPADDPVGIEIDLVEDIAAELGAKVEWIDAPQADLITALEESALDIVVGGFDSSDPHVTSVGGTRPYATTRLTVGLPAGETAPESIEGMLIAAEAGTDAIGLVRSAGATAEVVPDITKVRDTPAAVDQWLLDDLGLVDSGHHLAESKHAMAVPPGENAWLVFVERHLFAKRAEIVRAIADSGTS